MFKKLRRKFIIIMMSMVTVILVTVFGILIFANGTNSRNVMKTFMKNELMVRVGKERFKEPPDFKPDIAGPNSTNFPSLIIKSDNGNISGVIDRDLEHNGNVEDMYKRAMATRDKEGFGKFDKENIRFFVKADGNRADVIFSDSRFENESRESFIILCIIGFICAEAGFFVLSYFLSGWALKPVKEAWERQSQFIADASHELKTPITVMLADADILLSNGEETITRNKRWIDSIRDEAHSMKALVEEMLYIAKNDAQAQNYEIKEVNMSSIVMDKILEFESVAYEKRICFTNEVEDDVVVKAEETALERLISVLLDNAFKYCINDDGERAINVELIRLGGKARLSVSNTFPEPDQEEMKYYFDRFYRSSKNRTRENNSFGLGLSIASEIVKAFGGKIDCHYKDGMMRFEVTFLIK